MAVQREALWTLVVPDALLDDAAGWPSRWGLSRILARSVRRHLGIQGRDEVIGWAVTGHAAATRAWAPAPVGWAADFRGPPPLGVLRIDPVCLMPGPGGVTMAGQQRVDIDPEEARRLCDSLADAFRDRGIGVRLATPDRWYMTLPHAPDVPWWAPETVAGGSLLDYMPDGDGGSELRRIVNEIQMLLHEQPDNQSRRERQVPEVNSVWPWGWAERPVPKVGSVADRVYADHPYAAGLALLAGVDVSAPGDNVEEPEGAAVVVPSTQRQADPEWLETTWGRSVFRAATRKQLRGVRLVTPGGNIAEFVPQRRRRFPWAGSGGA